MATYIVAFVTLSVLAAVVLALPILIIVAAVQAAIDTFGKGTR